MALPKMYELVSDPKDEYGYLGGPCAPNGDGLLFVGTRVDVSWVSFVFEDPPAVMPAIEFKASEVIPGPLAHALLQRFHVPPHVQIIPARLTWRKKRWDYFWYRSCLRERIDVCHAKLSEFRVALGEMYDVKHAVLDADKLPPEVDVIPGKHGHWYVTERLKLAVEGDGLTGCRFLQVEVARGEGATIIVPEPTGPLEDSRVSSSTQEAPSKMIPTPAPPHRKGTVVNAEDGVGMRAWLVGVRAVRSAIGETVRTFAMRHPDEHLLGVCVDVDTLNGDAVLSFETTEALARRRMALSLEHGAEATMEGNPLNWSYSEATVRDESLCTIFELSFAEAGDLAELCSRRALERGSETVGITEAALMRGVCLAVKVFQTAWAGAGFLFATDYGLLVRHHGDSLRGALERMERQGLRIPDWA